MRDDMHKSWNATTNNDSLICKYIMKEKSGAILANGRGGGKTTLEPLLFYVFKPI